MPPTLTGPIGIAFSDSPGCCQVELSDSVGGLTAGPLGIRQRFEPRDLLGLGKLVEFLLGAGQRGKPHGGAEVVKSFGQAQGWLGRFLFLRRISRVGRSGIGFRHEPGPCRCENLLGLVLLPGERSGGRRDRRTLGRHPQHVRSGVLSARGHNCLAQVVRQVLGVLIAVVQVLRQRLGDDEIEHFGQLGIERSSAPAD